jgi:hypothetical protein
VTVSPVGYWTFNPESDNGANEQLIGFVPNVGSSTWLMPPL